MQNCWVLIFNDLVFVVVVTTLMMLMLISL